MASHAIHPPTKTYHLHMRSIMMIMALINMLTTIKHLINTLRKIRKCNMKQTSTTIILTIMSTTSKGPMLIMTTNQRIISTSMTMMLRTITLTRTTSMMKMIMGTTKVIMMSHMKKISRNPMKNIRRNPMKKIRKKTKHNLKY